MEIKSLPRAWVHVTVLSLPSIRMLLATASEHVLTFLRPKLSGRAFHAGLHLKESLPSDVPIKTKRLVSELPKWHVLPDGSIAQPLAEWKSGSKLNISPFLYYRRVNPSK